MQVRILGTLEASSGGDPLPLGGQKQRTVLAVLALRLGLVASTDELIEAGWGDDLPANPTNTLQYQIAQLRKIIEPDAAHPLHLITAKPGYRLNPETVTTDAQEFETSTGAARRAFENGDHDLARSLVDAALALWRGPALAEFRDNEFARSDAERLESERIAATELQIDIALATGRHAESTPRLAQLTDEHPLREGLWARRALALYRSGRQSEALRVFQGARDALAEIGLDPGPELRELEQRIIEQDDSLTPEASGATATPNNLPAAPNRLIGRDADVEKVKDLLGSHRLVTLTGPGGAGKTRLANAVGHALLGRYPRGIWLVPLDRLEDSSLLPAEVGRVTRMRENPNRSVLDTLADHLGPKRALLVLDSCEHLIEPVAGFVHDLLALSDQLSILTTSQITLETSGEAVFTVTPLSIPGQTPSIYDPITDIDAVALFVERARDAGAQVEAWDDLSFGAVANIVSALDGLPLALELAAAQTRSMSLNEIAQGLSDRFATLSRGPRTAPARQRSLLGAVEWSLDLLQEQQRTLIAKLSIFTGGFDADDAAAVTGEPLATVRQNLAEFVNHSLLTRQSDVAHGARFTMLETLRHHGVIALGPEQLASAHDAHLAHFTKFARAADAGIRGPDQISWLHRIDAHYDNIRAALAWSLDNGSLATGVQLAAHTAPYWDWRGLLKEGSAWTARLSTAADSLMPGLPSIRVAQAFFAWEYGELDQARLTIDLAIADAQALDDPAEIAAALSTRMLISRSEGDLESAQADGVAIGHAAKATGDPWLAAWAQSALATVFLAAGDLQTAEAHTHRSLELFAQLGDRRGHGWGLISLAQIELITGNIDDAQSNARAALASASAAEDDRTTLWALEILTETAHIRGDPERSARLWGAAQPLREARGLAGPVSKLSEPSDLAPVLSKTLGETFGTLVESGRNDPTAVIAEELIALDPAILARNTG